ncbi:MAG TPA: hypothetical protein VEZ11_03250, partial [Thermoanaerobaculia bacterium]|nr:hypothetical protein [Thermoanaerobaculia bacterium]
ALALHYSVFNAQNAALFLLPLTLPLAAVLSRRSPRWTLVLLTAIAIPIVWRVADLAAAGYLVPYSARTLYSDILPGPVFFDLGVGPPSLTDVFAMGYDYPFRLGTGAGIALTILSIVVATLLVWAMLIAAARGRGTPRENLSLLLAASFAAIGTATLCASGYYYDRYALDSAWAIGIALPLVIPWQRRVARIVAIAALVAVALFSTFAVQEYFAWNRARWNAFAALRAGGASVAQIDAGPEPYALYELANADRRKAHRPRPPCRYLLAFRPLPRYRTIAEYPFSGFMGTRQGVVYVLERR